MSNDDEDDFDASIHCGAEEMARRVEAAKAFKFRNDAKNRLPQRPYTKDDISLPVVEAVEAIMRTSTRPVGMHLLFSVFQDAGVEQEKILTAFDYAMATGLVTRSQGLVGDVFSPGPLMPLSPEQLEQVPMLTKDEIDKVYESTERVMTSHGLPPLRPR